MEEEFLEKPPHILAKELFNDGISSHWILKNPNSIMKTYWFKLDQPRRNTKNSWLKCSAQWILNPKTRIL
ncbi:hypothetical protein Gotur_023017 [Gossypium turneri]